MTDDRVVDRPDFLDRARAALEATGPPGAIQLRAHGLGGARFATLADGLRSFCSTNGPGLWINDRIDVALVVRAEGVQLGRRSVAASVARRMLGRSPWIGQSVHGSEEVVGVDAAVDLLVLGHIHATDSHPDAPPLGSDGLREAIQVAERPIVAIGGMTPRRAEAAIRAGAWGVAVRSGLWDAPDPAVAASRYREAVAAAVGEATEVDPAGEM